MRLALAFKTFLIKPILFGLRAVKFVEVVAWTTVSLEGIAVVISAAVILAETVGEDEFDCPLIKFRNGRMIMAVFIIMIIPASAWLIKLV